MTCKYPWSSIYVDNDNGKFNVKPCCRASNSVGTADSIEEIYDHPALQQIRDTFSSGATPDVCSACVDKREHSRSDPVFKGDVGIVDWDIRTDHVCNLKCAMCNPYQSSKWHEDLDIYQEYFKDTTIPRRPPNWDYILKHTRNTARRIYLAGGEPFYSKQVLNFLTELSKYPWNCANTQIEIQTNGVSLNNATFLLLQRFAKVHFCMSVDATEEVNHIIRFPTDWATFLDNYNQFKRINNNQMLFSVTVQAMNLPVLDTLVETFPEDRFILNQLNYPDILHINSLKPSVIQQVQRTTKLEQVKNMCDNYTYNAQGNAQLQKYLQDLDSRRNTRSAEFVPWVYL